jgi:hypothetical protein
MVAKLPLAVSVAMLMSSPVAFAYNLLKNPDFSGGTSGWNVTHSGGGTASWESYLSGPADGIGGSLRLDSDTGASPTPAKSHADQCVDVSNYFDIDVAVTKFDNAPGGGGTTTFKLEVYDGAACAGNILSTITLPNAGVPVPGNTGATWTEVSVLGTPLPSGAISAKINLDATAPTSAISYVLVDHILVVPPDEIFPDDLEGN